MLFCLQGDQLSLTDKQRELVACILDHDHDSELGKTISHEVRKARESAEWRWQYMKYEFDMALSREDGVKEGMQIGIEKGRAEGREEGLAEGRVEGRENGLRALVTTLKGYEPDFDKMLAAIRRNPDYADVSEEQVRAICREK